MFSGPITSTFNASHFDEIPFTYRCEKEGKKASRFEILHCYGAFSNDTMAVRGLTVPNYAFIMLFLRILPSLGIQKSAWAVSHMTVKGTGGFGCFVLTAFFFIIIIFPSSSSSSDASCPENA